jgi:predicted SprT family Zn-dependent metalloprotease
MARELKPKRRAHRHCQFCGKPVPRATRLQPVKKEGVGTFYVCYKCLDDAPIKQPPFIARIVHEGYYW